MALELVPDFFAHLFHAPVLLFHGDGVLSTKWPVSAIHGAASSRCWSAWSSSSVLILITQAAGSSISSSYCRPAFLSSCCIHPVEQLDSSYTVIGLPDRFLPQTKDIGLLVPAIISSHFAVTIHTSTSLSWTF